MFCANYSLFFENSAPNVLLYPQMFFKDVFMFYVSTHILVVCVTFAGIVSVSLSCAMVFSLLFEN